MFAMCVHELNQIWAFFFDQNHFESPKVMTLTFDLENEKRPYSIKLWCIRYLNAKFDGYILMWRTSILHCYKEGKKLQWPLVTLNLEIWSPENLYNPGCVLDICAKNEVHPTIGLGGVWHHTDTQTNRGPTAITV